MKKVLILYSSLTGNTQMAAMELCGKLQELVPENKYENEDINNLALAEWKKYDLVMIGVSTWGEGDFNPSSEDFWAKVEVENWQFAGMKFALFGLGDSSYVNYCGSVLKYEEKLKERGGEIVGEVHKIDGWMDEEKMERLLAWARTILSAKQA